MLISKVRHFLCAAMVFVISPVCVTEAANQTKDVSHIHSGDTLPFSVSIERAGFKLPEGVHSGVFATHEGKWLLLAGRTNGMHTFANNDDNFPPQKQNTWVFVVDPLTKKTYKRSLHSNQSGLSQHQIDLLSVTSPQFYQDGSTLYITGGYGVDTATGLFSTKDVLTAIDVPGLIHWTLREESHSDHDTAAKHIRQISNPVFQVTGGYMNRIGNHGTLLVFGQNFTGFYLAESNGVYTEQVRRFKISDNGKKLGVKIEEPKPLIPDPNFRRRDLNVVPAIQWQDDSADPYFIAFSGVFTLTGGAWTVPVTITPTGHPAMENPKHEHTFKQGMNNYACATVGLFSKEHQDFYNLFLGGISFGYFQGKNFVTDPELPFINQVTAIRRSHHGNFKQYILDAVYPVIPSKGANPGNPLLFGAGAQFVLAESIAKYGNDVLELDAIKEPTVVGYVVGGIQSSLPNTETRHDSAASAYIFKVTVSPKP